MGAVGQSRLTCPRCLRPCPAGTHLLTGEEVGIKLVRLGELPPGFFMLRCCMVCGTTAWMFERCHETARPDPLLSPPPRCAQESTKTKHPQLLYESKIYKILQGGSESALLLGLCRAAEAGWIGRSSLPAAASSPGCRHCCCRSTCYLLPLAPLRHAPTCCHVPAVQPASPTSGGTAWRATTM